MEFFRRLFGRSSSGSAQKANDRIRRILIHDRTDITPQMLGNLRRDMITVLTKYMEIDESRIEMKLGQDLDSNHDKRTVTLVTNIPILRVRRGSVDVADERQSRNNNLEEEISPADPVSAPSPRSPGSARRRHR
ncbi:MAG: cell division topological specificity factor MinE [Synergistaceae bacterium]|nr:cell division topological specificity factor MinE [Synergistaceae bacterium]